MALVGYGLYKAYTWDQSERAKRDAAYKEWQDEQTRSAAAARDAAPAANTAASTRWTLPPRGTRRGHRAHSTPVIAVIRKGSDFGHAAKYLFGPGERGEHVDAHVVAGGSVLLGGRRGWDWIADICGFA